MKLFPLVDLQYRTMNHPSVCIQPLTTITSAPIRRYRRPHPTLPFDRECTACRYAGRNKDDEPIAVGGAGPVHLEQVRLIVISDYPSNLEVKMGYPLVDNDTSRKRKQLIGWRNAGGMLRAALHSLYQLDTYTDCWFTNALKCDPRNEHPTAASIEPCVRRWLKIELEQLDSAVPTAPILIAGKYALAAMAHLIPKENLPQTLGKALRSTEFYWREHPLAFCHNPIQVSRSVYHLETDIENTATELKVKRTVELNEIIQGSPLWHFLADLWVLAPYLNKSASSSNDH